MNELHTNRTLMLILLLSFMGGSIWLGILSRSAYEHPLQHYIDLLLNDRIVQIIMLDFLFFFIWVVLWMADQRRETGRRVVLWIPLGLVAASLMIYLFIIARRKEEASS
jgi:hypothetical protein